MKASSFLLIIFFLISGFSSQVNSQSDSCSSNLNISSIQFDTSNLNCNPVWPAQDFILRYAEAGPNLWSFVLSAPNPNTVVAIGFSPKGNMVGSSAVVGWVASDGTAMIKQYFLGGQTPTMVEPDKGNLVINASMVATSSNRIFLTFQLTTAMPERQLLYAVGPQGAFPVSPDFRLSQHSNKIATNINYVSGQSQTENSPYSKLRKTHGVLNMLGWGILLPIGVIIARYFKQHDPAWFYSHVSIQSLGFILGVAGVICGFVLEHKTSAAVKKHKGLGTFVLVLGSLQVMAFLARPDKASKYRTYWNWYHYTVGRLAIFFAAVNIFYGIHLGHAGASWNAGFAVVVVGLFIVAAVLEIRMWMRK
ncbi:hypothetical protein NMG60_11034383 [Bertholletia excelsa]